MGILRSAVRLAAGTAGTVAGTVVDAPRRAVQALPDALPRVPVPRVPIPHVPIPHVPIPHVPTPPRPQMADLEGLIGPRTKRRIWSRSGRAYIELRGVQADHTPAAADLRTAASAAVRRMKGVRWAEVNAVTGELLCVFDEGKISLDALVEAVTSVEDEHGVPDEAFPMHTHPADQNPITAETIALASDCAAFAMAATGRWVRWPKLPPAARLALVWVDNQPRLRRELELRLGPHGADLMLAVGNAVLHGLTQEPAALAVDAVHRGVLLTELTARRAAWCRWEEELCAPGLPAEAPQRADRPRPLPDGPVERCGDRTALAAMLGAGGLLAANPDPAAAADLMLTMVPKAARLGRAGFAAILDREMARIGVVPLDGSAYRRLDRIDTVVVDSRALCGEALEILSADDAATWRVAARLLRRDPEMEGVPDRDGRKLERLDDRPPEHPEGTRLRVWNDDGTALGEVVVGRRLEPLAEAVLSAARDGDTQVLLTRNASTADLRARADDVLDAEVPLADHVRDLQRDGRGVALVTVEDEDAALAADVGIGILGGRSVSWGADLVCTGGLAQVWRLLTAIPVAHEASERAVRLSAGGTSLGALLVLTQRRSQSPLKLAPVQGAALSALVGGVVTARRLASRPLPAPMPRVPWHALDPESAVEQAMRLRPGDEEERPRRHRVRSARPVRAATDLARAVGHELQDPLTPILVLGAAGSSAVGSGVDAALVGGVMAGNAVISGVQHARAERALRGLLLGQRPPARRVDAAPDDLPPIQNGNGWERCQTLPAERLRPGDIIAVGPSDVVPADARLLAAEGLEVDEASLTGESLPVGKSLEAVPGADLADRSCMVFEDTTVLTGRGYAVVVATGPATQAERAAVLAGRGAAPTGVQAQLNEVTRIALPLTGASGALVSLLGLVRGVSMRQAISSGVAVAFAAVPEGLPLVATVAQLAAARRLSKRGVLVRSSRTLGTMGRVDTLCFDKTGTLTEGRLKLSRVSGPGREVELDSAPGRRVLTAAVRACPQGPIETVKHATDRAVIEAAERHLDGDPGWELLHETPFEPSRGFAAATGRDGDAPYVAVKGAPEAILPRCHRVAEGKGTKPLTDERRAKAREAERGLAGRGLRVLAVAEARPGDLDDVEKLGETVELVLLGFVGIADPLRPGAAEAITTLADAGIRVAMITGDHPETARAIAAELGIATSGDDVMTGAELDRLSERERIERIPRTSVFARVTPEHKVGIVKALRRSGRVVAMTGDGANDAAAIRLADVGIGLTSGDSRAAPSAADLILPGGDLPGIVAALLEGRTLWESVRNAVSILVGGNAGEIAFTVYGTALGGKAPLSTRQLLLVNTLTDMLPALAVALAAPGADDERPPGRGTLGDPLRDAIALRGVVTALGAIMAWQAGRFTALPVARGARAGTMGLAALVLTQLLQTLQTGWRSPWVVATCAASLVVLAAVIETPGVSTFFGCVPLGPVAWAQVVAASGTATALGVLAPRVPVPEPVSKMIDKAWARAADLTGRGA
ncbi:cation-translocating P-type ATPase [Actinomadura kijaniata]|uniref:cation-translocating P-type ATPase n=1 Tax=Actinomadura kijaniata TaxID=46161 RepID=UPI002FEA3D43